MWRDEVREFLSPLEPLYPVWDDTEIEPGDNWREKIDAQLAEARVVVLLVSQNFENSEFILKNELGPALEAVKDGVRVFSIAVTDVAWEQEPLHSLLGPYQWAYGPPSENTGR